MSLNQKCLSQQKLFLFFRIFRRVFDTTSKIIIIIYYYSVCSSGGPTSCKHSTEEIMDYDNSTIILAKINGDCDEICQDLKKSADSDFEEMDKKAAIIFQNEEEKAGKTVIKLNDLSKQ